MGVYRYPCESKNWSGRQDLNLRPLAPQASALARLRYAPTETKMNFQKTQKPKKKSPNRSLTQTSAAFAC